MIEQDQAIAILKEQIDFQANAIQMSSVLLAKIFGIAIYSKTMKNKCMTIRVPRYLDSLDKFSALCVKMKILTH